MFASLVWRYTRHCSIASVSRRSAAGLAVLQFLLFCTICSNHRGYIHHGCHPFSHNTGGGRFLTSCDVKNVDLFFLMHVSNFWPAVSVKMPRPAIFQRKVKRFALRWSAVCISSGTGQVPTVFHKECCCGLWPLGPCNAQNPTIALWDGPLSWGAGLMVCFSIFGWFEEAKPHVSKKPSIYPRLQGEGRKCRMRHSLRVIIMVRG